MHLGALGLNAFNHPWKFQVGYVFLPPALVLLAEHITGQFRLLILVVPCLMEAPWLPTVLNLLADIPWHCPVINDLVMDVSVGQVLKHLLYLHLTLWLLSDMCYGDRFFFLSLSGGGRINLSIFNEGLPAVSE